MSVPHRPNNLYQLAGLLAKAVAAAGLVCFLILAAMTVLDVLMRWLFNSPISAVGEFSGLITAVSVAATFPIALWSKRGVAVRIFGAWFGPTGNVVLELLSHMATIGVLAVIVYQMGRFATREAAMNSATWLLHWPTAPWWWAVTVILGIALLVEALVPFDTIHDLRRGDQASNPTVSL